MRSLIIEVRGGIVQEVYTDATDLRVILVDWDAGESPGDQSAGGDFSTSTLADVPAETLSAVLQLTR